MTNEKPPAHAHATPAPSAGGRAVSFSVITVSDTRTPETDVSGKLAQELIVKAGHAVGDYRIVKDESHQIREAIHAALGKAEVQIVFLTGGTGISPRDTTPDVVEEILDKQLPGFGELFRQLSYAEIGTATILSRATGGAAQGKGIFSAPGSRAAVKLALEAILLPEASHIVAELHKKG